MRFSKNNLLLLSLLVLFMCLVSFLAGIYTLRNGTLRKMYDIFFAIQNFQENSIQLDANTINKLDTITFQLSKKKQNTLIKIRSNKINTLENITTYGQQWIGERPWIKAEFALNTNPTLLKGKFKLVGMNPDHFRESNNWSIRVKLSEGQYLYKYRKFNLLNPYSRGFFVDAFYNELYKKQGGMDIDSKPILSRVLDTYNLQIFEPFFSKELIENQACRDYMIISHDSTDIKGKSHLKVVHPNGYNDLSKRQKEVYQFYEDAFQRNKLIDFIHVKDYAFLAAVGINTGNTTHHFEGFNLNFYVNPISGELKPFLREIEFIQVNLPTAATKFEQSKKDFLTKTGINKSTYRNFKEFNYWLDYYSQQIQGTKIDEFIQSTPDLRNIYFYTQQYYPWSFGFKKRIRVPIQFTKNLAVKHKSNKKLLITPKTWILKDSIYDFSIFDEIQFSDHSKIIANNATIIFSGKISRMGKQTIECKGDKNSTIVFENATVNLHHFNFKGFGNAIKTKNREVTSAITFYNSTVNLHHVSFSGNYSGDDLVNLFRSKFNFEQVQISYAKYDGIDADFSMGIIKHSLIRDCGNDGIDFGGSQGKITETNIIHCGDKGISIGEKSQLDIQRVRIQDSEIALGLKDESKLKVNEFEVKNNHLDLAAYGKKGMFKAAQLTISTQELSKLNYLIEPSVVLTNKNSGRSTVDIKNYMYGKKYGKASSK
jgi:hypothetical protein